MTNAISSAVTNADGSVTITLAPTTTTIGIHIPIVPIVGALLIGFVVYLLYQFFRKD